MRLSIREDWPVAEEVVVKEQLTPDMVAAGHELTRLLRQDRNFGLVCSLWLYTSESNRWKLVVATPIVNGSGPIHTYQVIQGIIRDEWRARWDVVFNFTEGPNGTMGRESQVPVLLEAYGIRATFSDSATLALCLDKAKTKVDSASTRRTCS